MESTDAFISTVATTIPVFMIATMIELARLERGKVPERGWVRKIDATVYWGSRILGWTMIVVFAFYEVALIHQLSLPPAQRIEPTGITVVLATSVFFLLVTVALGALSRSEARSTSRVPEGALEATSRSQ